MLGAFNIIKPTGWTSSDVVVKVRGILRKVTGDKKIKVGHLGTLDPAGSGVLPIVFGKATKLFDYFCQGDKIYRAKFNFGKTTDTLDSFGSVVECCDIIPSFEDIKAIIPRFLGEIEQVPPKYSRICVNGERAVDIARQGEDFDLPARWVKIFAITPIDYENGILTLDIHCSGGTYIRSLCRDMANLLGTVAYMSCIIRLVNKGFKIENAITLDELCEDCIKHIIPIEQVLKDIKKIAFDEDDAFRIINGLQVLPKGIKEDYLVEINGKIFGICKDGKDQVEVLVRLWN